MTDFTTLFTQTLNDTIAKAVAETVANATATPAVNASSDLFPSEAPTHITLEIDAYHELITRIRALENKVEELDQVDMDDMVEKVIDNYNFTRIIEDHDYTDVVTACIKDSFFEGIDFDNAVTAVIDEYDFAEIVNKEIDFETFVDGSEFAQAVRTVIGEALSR